MIKNILIVFGLLDLYSFARTYKLGIKMIENIENFPLMSIAEIILILSLLITGILSILRKKISFTIYYFQTPLRIAFMILTFGFLLKIFGLPYDSIGYKMIVGVTFSLELVRLLYSIWIHKRIFKKQ